MADVTQFSFSLREVAEILVRERGLKTGKWMLAFEFGVGVGNFGDPQSNMAVRPGVMTTLGGVVLTRATEPFPPGPVPDFVVDAAAVK